MSNHRVTIRFAAPAAGADPETGELFDSTLHRVDAERLLQDASRSIFVSELGELVAEWPTELIVSVKWGPPARPHDVGTEDKVMPEREPSRSRLKAQLERWRSDLAQTRNVRSSSILSNAAIAEITDALPRSMRELRSLEHIQPNQLRASGLEIVQLITDAFAAVNAPHRGRDASPHAGLPPSRDSIDSLPAAVRRRFEVSISASGRFARPGWFYVGVTVADCPVCGEPLEGFRAPYTSGGKTYHYWALVCLDCATMFEPADLDSGDQLDLYASSELRPHAND